jgi:hypothetical protein
VAPIVAYACIALADRKEKYSLDFFCFLFIVKKKRKWGYRNYVHCKMMFGQSPEMQLNF